MLSLYFKMKCVEFPDLGLEFLAEGAANVVYKIVSPSRSPSIESEIFSNDDAYGPGTPPPTEIPMLRIDPLIQGKLVRLRKDVPTAISVVEAQDAYEKHIKPYFQDDELVEQVTTHLALSLIERCNTDLHLMESEGTRSPKRAGVFLKVSDGCGSLVTDMSPTEDQTFLSFEFKPKWLVQSPSAPAGAKRCRTCALRAMRVAEQSSESVTEKVFCPLGLLSNEEETVKSTLSGVLDGFGCTRPETLDCAVKFLYRHPLIQKLKQLQVELDPKGMLTADVISVDYLTAMTLRDCTLFIKVRNLSTRAYAS